MADYQVIINSQVYKLIPYGFCACGCGEKTNIATRNNASKQWVIGRYYKYVKYHIGKVYKNPYGRKNNFKHESVRNKNHHRQSCGKVWKHILIAEAALGKPLKLPHVVHHHTPEQLVICQNDAYHKLIHQRTRAYKACGHANWKRCLRCRKYSPENLLFKYRYNNHTHYYHRSKGNGSNRICIINNPTP